MSEDIILGVLYVILSIFVIYPPTEFVAAGLTIPVIFSSYLGSEHESFINYHIKRANLTLLVYSLLPLGYVVLSFIFGSSEEVTVEGNAFLWSIFFTFAFSAPLVVLWIIKSWSDNDCQKHPIAVNLSKFVTNSNMHWRSVASDIDIEFRRIEKLCLQTNSITKIVATENWILKVVPLNIYVTHQSDTELVVKSAETYDMSIEGPNRMQYVNIEVKSDRRGVDPYIIRINSADFKDLQNRLTRNISIPPNVKFHKSIVDEFVDVFKQTIQQNPLYPSNELQATENCIGCLQARPNVKIQKICDDSESDANNRCSMCYCRPMWCSDCIARWFASRQDQEQMTAWLSSKSTCPMCRAKFCVLDVCLLSSINLNQ